MYRPEELERLPSPSAGVCASTLPIDVSFDVDFADEIARLESYNKHHYRPNTYMHKWWARRCGSTFRLILKHLVAEGSQRDYYAAGGLEGRVILDPMMGGGTTLHEAIRLGANVVGVDIDPIPVLQARATLSDVPLAALEEAFVHFTGELDGALGDLFQTECPHCQQEVPLRFTLYGAQRRCDCGPVLMVDSTVLRYEGSRPSIRLCADCGRVIEGSASCGCAGAGDRPLLVEKEIGQCDGCGQPYEEEVDLPFFMRYSPVAIVAQCPTHGLFFTAPRAADLQRLAEADRRRQALVLGEAGAFMVGLGPKTKDLRARGVHNYQDLFSSRQLLYLQEAMALLPQFDPLVRLNLALLVSTSLEFNSMLCGYKGARQGQRPGAIRHTFSYHAYSFPYTALENNLLYQAKASGTLEKLFHDRIRRARHWARQPRERVLEADGPRFRPVKREVDGGVEVADPGALQDGPTHRFLLRQASAESLPLPDHSVDFVVTDPPYYDSVQYSDLAAFFRVWLRHLIPEAGPHGPHGVGWQMRWEYDLGQSAVDPQANGSGQYQAVLSRIFAECQRVLRPEQGRLIFTFHNWKAQGWTALTLALQRADFSLVNRYVVHSENPVSVHIANMRALMHDAILVLAPQPTASGQAWQPPEGIDKNDSARFCENCATLLGWLLERKLPEAEVARCWQEALG